MGNLDRIKTNVVCLPKANYAPKVGETCYLAGRGAEVHHGNPTDELRSVDTKILPDKTCEEFYHEMMYNSDVDICLEADGKGPCDYDSGGPVVCVVKGEPVLVGVISKGKECGKYPVISSETSVIIDWMKSIISIYRFA